MRGGDVCVRWRYRRWDDVRRSGLPVLLGKHVRRRDDVRGGDVYVRRRWCGQRDDVRHRGLPVLSARKHVRRRDNVRGGDVHVGRWGYG